MFIALRVASSLLTFSSLETSASLLLFADRFQDQQERQQIWDVAQWQMLTLHVRDFWILCLRCENNETVHIKNYFRDIVKKYQ